MACGGADAAGGQTDRPSGKPRRGRGDCDGLSRGARARSRRDRHHGGRRADGPAGPTGGVGAFDSWRSRLREGRPPGLAGCPAHDALASVARKPRSFVLDGDRARRPSPRLAMRLCRAQSTRATCHSLGRPVDGLWVSKRSARARALQSAARNRGPGSARLRRRGERHSVVACPRCDPFRDC